MNFKTQLLDLLAIKRPCIQIRTNLEKEVFPALLNILYENDFDSIYRITEIDKVEKINVNTQGQIIRKTLEGEYGPVQFNPNVLLETVRGIINDKNNKEKTAFLFFDYDSKFDNSMFRRWIKEVFELRNENYAPFIFVSSEASMPDDLNHLFSIMYYDNPTEKEIVDLLKDYSSVKNIEINNLNDLAHKFIGFNRTEIIECLDYSFYKFDEVNDSYIKEKRIEIIKKSNVLRYREPKMNMDDMAGNKFFKDWYQETKFAFEPDAKDYGVPMPKGFMATGPAGTSKSMSAEMIAADLKLPLIVLDLSAILSKFVGDSERNIDQAIQTINQLAPCVLLIDECEKALAGVASSHGSDSGTLARVFGKVLNLLADNNNGIYTVMTSNNAKILPPELTRAGRLDAIFFFDFPSEEERIEIFDLHFKKRGHKISKVTLKKIAKETKNYTGAEIEQIVISAIKKAFVKMKREGGEFKITSDILIDAKNNVVPVSVSSKETIAELKDWAKGRALFSNKSPEESNKKKSVLNKLDDIDIDDII